MSNNARMYARVYSVLILPAYYKYRTRTLFYIIIYDLITYSNYRWGSYFSRKEFA